MTKKNLLIILILTTSLISVACQQSVETIVDSGVVLEAETESNIKVGVKEEDSKIIVDNPEVEEAFELLFIDSDYKVISMIKEKNSKVPYSIYSYGGDVFVSIDDEIISLADALEKKNLTVEEILEKADEDRLNGTINGEMFKDGGTRIYNYPNYTILKYNTLDGLEDLYIGNTNMKIGINVNN